MLTMTPSWYKGIGQSLLKYASTLHSSDGRCHRYLILAVRTQILVYSTETSNLVRSLRLEEHETITSYTTSAANKNHLFVSTYSGLLSKWDWTTGQLIKQWKSSDKLIFITEHFQDQKDAASSTLLLIHEALEQTAASA